MSIPYEIRQQILSYALPHTIARKSTKETRPLWCQGSTALLATNNKLHDEGAKIMYGDAQFLIEVSYDGIKLIHYRILKSGLTPKKTPDFYRTVSKRYWSFMRNVTVVIIAEDSYTSEIKYNMGGSGFVAGLRVQTTWLVETLRAATKLSNLEVVLKSDRSDGDEWEDAWQVLEPFLGLSKVEHSIWRAPIEDHMVERLKRQVSKSVAELASG